MHNLLRTSDIKYLHKEMNITKHTYCAIDCAARNGHLNVIMVEKQGTTENYYVDILT